jgi:hypothetical protein
MNSGADLDPGRCGIGPDRGRAADGLSGGVEGGQQAVRAVLDHAAPVSPDQVPGRGFPYGRRTYRLGVQDRGQDPIGIAWLRRRGEKICDLGIHRVVVTAGGEPQRVITGLLEIASARDVGGQVTAVAGRRDAVAEALDHQRGHVDRGQHRADVDVVDHLRQPEERAGVYRHALEPPEQLARAGRVGLAGQVPLDGLALSPPVRRDVPKRVVHLLRPLPARIPAGREPVG